MNKLPAKQIYLLLIIVLGIIALSIYSTYSIFTFDSQSSDVVSINTPNSLSLNMTTNEYKQIKLLKDSYITTDIDIYNNFDYNLCYSIWYQLTNKNISSSIRVYENTDDIKNASGTVQSYTSKRVKLILVNDGESDTYIKFGVSYAMEEDTCSLNLSSDKQLVTSTINNPKELSMTLINDSKVVNNNANYLTYKNMENNIILSNDDEIYVSNKFTYNNELFTLEEPVNIKSDEINTYKSNFENNYYTCLHDKTCKILHRIIETSNIEKNEQKEYSISKYDKMIGYLSGESGLRNINNNYVFYGDNPNNFIYYNCTNLQDNNTCELWRIVGFTYDNVTNKYLTKIIRNESIGLYDYSSNSQTWNESNIYKFLNNEYKINNSKYLKEISYKQSFISNLDKPLTDISYFQNNIKSKVSILSLEDYLNSSTCKYTNINEYTEECLKNNWLNDYDETPAWTMSANYVEPYTDEESNELVTPNNNTMYFVSDKITDLVINDKLNVRPVVYLNSRVFLVAGDGSLDNPYVIR